MSEMARGQHKKSPASVHDAMVSRHSTFPAHIQVRMEDQMHVLQSRGSGPAWGLPVHAAD